MENLWSKYVQSSEELYLTRSLRFRDDNTDLWLRHMRLADGMKILEIGCGGGLLCHQIKAHLPNSTVTGIDRDEGHINFARDKSVQIGDSCEFIVGDALNLPFIDNSFDAVTSHTVVEHIETSGFLREQYRILKPGGLISVLFVNNNLGIYPDSWQAQGEEAELMNKAWANTDFNAIHGIGAFMPKENQLPADLESAGFSRVNVNIFTIIPYAPDNADTPPELALQQIHTYRICALSQLHKALKINPEALNSDEIVKLENLINKRFDARIDSYKQAEKLWDLSASTVVVATGYKMEDANDN